MLLELRRKIKPREKLQLLVQVVLFPLNFIIGLYMGIICKFYPYQFKLTYDWFAKCGFLPVAFHYYQPIMKSSQLNLDYDKYENAMTGIDWRESAQLELLDSINFREEVKDIPLEHTGRFDVPHFNNPFYPHWDALSLYGMIRKHKPARIIEIGSGFSTLFAKLAVNKNLAESGKDCEMTCIEPFEKPWLEENGIEVIREMVENVDRTIFASLKAGDILFIDSSHQIRPRGDVLFEFLDLLPIIPEGVIVQVHDIYLPRNYPRQWIEKYRYFYNEQYLLQALLMNSGRYEIMLAVNFMFNHHRNKLENLHPELSGSEKWPPSSFWFRIKSKD